MLLVAPLTSKIKNGDFRITISINGIESQILLFQVRIISCRRLIRRIGLARKTILQASILCLLNMILLTYKNETPQKSGESRGPEEAKFKCQ